MRGRGGNGIQISHVLFADETSYDLSVLVMEAISGLKINLVKNENSY